MTGVIWIVQTVHYPAFTYVREDEFSLFSLFHQGNITLIVMPAMLIELATGIFLVIQNPSPIYIVNSIGILLIFAITFFISVPLHRKLTSEKNEWAIKQLVRTNWLRTWLWSARSLLLLTVVF